MAQGARIVDRANIVQDVAQFFISKDGQVREIVRALVACGGRALEFWPSTLEPSDTIVMDSVPDFSYDSESVAVQAPQAFCNYDARTGNLILSRPDGTTVSVGVLNPAPRGTGYYAIRFDPVSGTFDFNDPTGVWLDVYGKGSLGLFEWWLPNAQGVPSTEYGEADFSVTQLDELGAPIPGTTVVKRIDFTAEIVGSNFRWSAVPWTIEDVRLNEPARAWLVCVPSGFGTGDEINAAYITGNVGLPGLAVQTIYEIYAFNWSEIFEVKVDVVSGAVDGDPTGVFLPTAERRDWWVQADNDGDDFTAEVDVTVTDGVSTVTKRVTMRAARTDELAESELDDEFTQFDRVQDFYIAEGTERKQTQARIDVDPDGFLYAEILDEQGTQGQPTGFPQKWNTSAGSVPDPQNFECRLTLLPTGGDINPTSDIPDGSPNNVWLNLSSRISWWNDVDLQDLTDRIYSATGTYLLEIREVGRPETVLAKTVELWAVYVPTGTPPPGDGLPPGGDLP